MRAHYFIRAALILCALFAGVQPVQASGTVALVSDGVLCLGGYTCWAPGGNTSTSVPTLAGNCSSYPTATSISPVDSSQISDPIYLAAWNVAVLFPNAPFPASRRYVCLKNSAPVGICPANSTGTTTCTCTDPYIPNAGATACVMPACPAANSSAGSYWINSGTIPDSLYTAGLGQQCLNGCQTEGFSAVVTAGGGGNAEAATKIVAGVKQYYAKRYFYYTGQTCTGTTQPSSGDVPGQQTCAAGQSYIQMGAQFKCINPVTGQTVDTNSASAVAAAQSLEDARIAAQIAAAGSAVAAAGGSASAVENARSVAAGVAAAGGSDSGSSNPDPVQSSFCAENPTSSICQETEFGNVDDSTLGDKSVSVAISPVSVGGSGSCPAPSVMVLHGHTYYFDWTTYCNFANGIRPILLAFAWLAAAGILVGGFMA